MYLKNHNIHRDIIKLYFISGKKKKMQRLIEMKLENQDTHTNHQYDIQEQAYGYRVEPYR